MRGLFKAARDAKHGNYLEHPEVKPIAHDPPLAIVETDPIARWRKRQESLRAEKDRHIGLKKYADFMLQTEQFRSDMDEAEASLSRHIDQQIDEARERRAMGEE